MNERAPRDLTQEIRDLLTRNTGGWLGTLEPWKRYIAGGGAAALVLLLLLWANSGDGTGQRYTTAAVSRGDITVVITATGSVEPTNKVDVSSELSGMVRSVRVDYNSQVKVGEVLAELDTDKLKATVESSRAKLAAARAKVADAKATLIEKERDFIRKRDLEAKNITSTHDRDLAQAAFDRAVAGVASAEADVGVAQADLTLNETNLAKACICSPINGIVLVRNVDPGQTVASSFQAPVLFSIAEDLKKMEILVDVDEADVGKVKVDQIATFTVDAYPDRKFPAKIREVRFASEIVQGVVTYKAILAIDNADLLLRPGMTATAEITVDQVRNALLVPNSALRFTPPSAAEPENDVGLLKQIIPGRPPFRAASKNEAQGANRTLWVLRDNRPVGIAVEVGASDGNLTEITKGEITESDQVIIDTVASAT